MAKSITYIIREKHNDMILHRLPDQQDRNLTPKEVYADFDAASMEMGWTEQPVLPEYFRIETGGKIRELSLKEQVDEGIIALAPDEKVVRNQIVRSRQISPGIAPSPEPEAPVTDLATLIRQGTIALAPDQKVVDDQIVSKSLEELLAEGLITLAPDQKIEHGKIVQKNQVELVAVGVIVLQEPFEYLKGKQIESRSVGAALKGGLIKTKEQAEEGLRRIREEIEREIAGLYSTSEELKITKAYLDWMAAGSPAGDERQAEYVQMQQEIATVKAPFEKQKAALKKLLD